LAIALAGLVLVPTHARADEPASSAVSQYVEIVPTSGGGTAPGVGEQKVTPLPQKSDTVLEQVAPAAAPALKEVATSSTYGAPVNKVVVHPASPHTSAARVLHPRKSSAPTVPSPALALGGGTPGSLAWLGVVMLATACILATATIRRRRVA
jgi:hypothetical protein